MASDFHKLTNRMISSSPFTPDFAHESPAECTSDGRTVVTPDKRAISSTLALDSLRDAHGLRLNDSIRKSSCSSVKEDEDGKTQLPYEFRHLLPHHYLKILR